MEILTKMHSKENAVEEGKAFAYAYTTTKDMSQLVTLMSNAYNMHSENSGSGIAVLDNLLNQSWEKYMHTNALNPLVRYTIKFDRSH